MEREQANGSRASVGKDPVVEDYARQAAQYDKKWGFYTRATIRETMRRLRVEPGQSLLDIGCGTGALLEAVSKKHPGVALTGVDPTAGMLTVARKKLPESVVLKEGWAEELPFEKGAFDLVVSCNMFHYLRDPESALSEARRVLKPGGTLVITDWCHDYLACKACHLFLSVFDPAHFTMYGASDCRDLVSRNGFHDVEIERYKINWLWGMMTARGVKKSDA